MAFLKMCMKVFMCSVVLGYHASSLLGQNLVPNPSFETYTTCPMGVGMGGNMLCPPWVSPVTTADYFNVCDFTQFTGVPYNFQGFQYAHTGVAYAGFYTKTQGQSYREWVQAPLLAPLIAGFCYKVSFWVNSCNVGCATDQMGALLNSDGNLANGTPQVSWGTQLIADSVDWVNLTGFFVAQGNEAFITIGTMAPDNVTHFDPACGNMPFYGYYYVDDVLVELVDFGTVDVDLGPDVTVCDSFIIDPGNPDFIYHWSNGAVGPTLTVYTSGTYSVTASYGCDEEVDEIEVTILHPVEVEIDPDSMLICEGDGFDIELDPDLGTYIWSEGTNGPNITLTEAGTYSVTLDDGCTLSSDTIQITTLAPPLPFTLGADTTLCPGESYDITFDAGLGDFEWQDGSGDSFYTIDNDITYALTISNMCGEESDDLEVTIVQPPVLVLEPQSVFICGDQPYDLQLDPDQGQYTWNDGTMSNEYTITETGYYFVTVSNVCGEESGEIYVSFTDIPDFDLGPDQVLCTSDTVDLLVPFQNGTYTWQDGSHNTTYEVTASGTYALTVSNSCGIDFDSVQVDFTPPIISPTLGPDFSLCPGQQAVLYAGSPGASYLWSDASTADSLVVSASGTYFVTAYTACESFTDSLVVAINSDPPSIQLPADFDLCQGQTITLDAGVSGVTYLWSDGSVMPQLQVTMPGTYALTVSNTCGTSIDTVIIGAGDIVPGVALGADTSICAGGIFTLSPAYTNVDSWLWQDGSTLTSLEVTTPGVYHVEVSNSCGSAFDTLVVGLLPAIPTIDLGADATICAGQAAMFNIPWSGVDIVWSDGSTGNSITVNTAGSVYATVSNSCGTSADTALVTLLPEPPDFDLGPDQTICPGEVFIMDPGLSGVSFVWQDGSTNPAYQATTGGTYIVTVSTVCGSESDTLVLTESTNGPMVDLGPDVEACEGEIVTIASGISGVQYVWQDGSTQSVLSVAVPGLYSVTVTNLCGVDMDTVEVVYHPLPPGQELGPDTSLCEGLSLVLRAVTDPNFSVLWQDQSSQQTYTVTLPGLYSVQVSNQCGETTDSVEVTYLDAPDPFYLGPDTLICAGETVVLQAPVTPYVVRWSDGSTGPQLVVSSMGVYGLEVSNECGLVIDSLAVVVSTEVPIVQLQPEWLWCPGDQFTLDAGQVFSATYLWSTGATSSAIEVGNPGLYTVEVKSACGEAGGQSEVVMKDDCPTGPVFYIPNVFTPDGNGVNDVFSVYTDIPNDILSMQGKILDRWGNVVFASGDNPFTWDGHFAGELMNPGVYVYTVKVRYVTPNGEKEEVFSGDVTLVK